jgi:hypothetical protein
LLHDVLPAKAIMDNDRKNKYFIGCFWVIKPKKHAKERNTNHSKKGDCSLIPQ